MKVYDVKETSYSSHVYSVVAPNIAIAEKVYLIKYPSASIYSITLHSEYVEIAPQNIIEADNISASTVSMQVAEIFGQQVKGVISGDKNKCSVC